jgi:hypothetical protein
MKWSRRRHTSSWHRKSSICIVSTGCSSLSSLSSSARLRSRRDRGEVMGGWTRLEGVQGALLEDADVVDAASLSLASSKPRPSKPSARSSPGLGLGQPAPGEQP